MSHRFDRAALPLADAHYSRQKPGTPQFVAPGSNVVLVAGEPVRAVWVSLLQKHADHAWPGAWVCSMFANRGAGLSSELIREAVAATRAEWGSPPRLGMVTFVDGEATAARRGRQNPPGWCFRCAGFVEEPQRTKKRGLVVLRLAPEDMPEPCSAIGATLPLFGRGAA